MRTNGSFKILKMVPKQLIKRSKFPTNLKDGMGVPCAGQSKDKGVLIFLMKDIIRVSWENLGADDPIGSVVTTNESTF